jgi:hypothetical protein
MALRNWEPDKQLRWHFVVDTDSPADGFDRHMVAFVTGMCREGEDGYVRDYLELFKQDYPAGNVFNGLVEHRIDDHSDSDALISWAPWANAPSPPKDDAKEDDEAQYNSVAIFLRREPTYEQWETLVRRARAFCKLEKLKSWEVDRPAIVNLRLVTERVTLYTHRLNMRIPARPT